MAHTIGKFQYLLIERTFLEGKQIDEYFELANSEKIAIAIAEEWERGYNATQTAPNVLRAEFDTGFGTTEVRELALLSVPVVTGVGRPTDNAVYLLVTNFGNGGRQTEELRAYMTLEEASEAMIKAVEKGRFVGIYNHNKYGVKTSFGTMEGAKIPAYAFIDKVKIHIL